jgi:uridine phosphorylase
MISGYFDKDKETKTFHSSRGFTTYTGYYKGVPVSVVAIGMGVSMMDFFVRESRAIIDGPMAIIRYGTCGGIAPESKHGKYSVASMGAGYVARNPDAFENLYTGNGSDDAPAEESYHFYKLVPADQELSHLVAKNLREFLKDPEIVVEGVNVTADSFYSSQGRIDDRFYDHNHGIIDLIQKKYPAARSLEMETFTLFHLAKSAKQFPIKAAAAAIIVANRLDNCVIEDDVLHHIETTGGEAVLQALIEVTL